MQANPDKFQVIAGGGGRRYLSLVLKRSGEPFWRWTLTINSISIKNISNLCRKAGQQLNVLKRLSPFLSKLNRLTIVHTFTLSNFNYCPPVWPICAENNSRKFERIPERALSFVYGDFVSSYDDLLVKANIPSLHIRRQDYRSRNFKILNDMPPPVL